MTKTSASALDLVIVAGATGGVGQLTVSKLLELGLAVRVLTRSADKASKMFEGKVEIALGDIRHLSTLEAAMRDVAYIICCTGTSAFPSRKWGFKGFLSAENTPQQVDAAMCKKFSRRST